MAQAETTAKPMCAITVAAVNMHVVHDKDTNLRKIDQFIEEAAGKGAGLILFPEQALQGCIWSLSHTLTAEEWLAHRRAAEPIPGPSIEWFTERAKAHHAVIAFGMTERHLEKSREKLYNACAVVGPEGLIGAFRKVHLVGDEVHLFHRGAGWPVFEAEAGKLGVLICYDSQFPEAARALALGGAQILLMPTAWAEDADDALKGRGGELFDLLTRVRAQENQTWLMAANQVGEADVGDMRFYGHSRIVAPTGQVVAELTFEEGVALATLDLTGGLYDGMLHSMPPGLDYLADRRPGTYGRLVES